MTTPRVFIIRHGETEWSLNGRHTGTTELPLTENGEKRIRATGKALVGEDRLICPTKLAHVYISPRARARRTLELLGLGLESPEAVCQAKVDITEDLAEWDYGDYEGLKSAEIRELRRSRGLDKERDWDIWRDGCEGGESPKEVEERCDKIIEKIRKEWHAPAMESGKDSGDVLCVAHGHLLRAFAMRWVGKRLEEPLSLILEAGGVGTLSYEHHSIKEPAILLGGSFVVNVVEAATKNADPRDPSS